jgi:hypothetical protein
LGSGCVRDRGNHSSMMSPKVAQRTVRIQRSATLPALSFRDCQRARFS